MRPVAWALAARGPDNYLRARESDYQEASRSAAKALQPDAEGALQKALRKGVEGDRIEPQGASEVKEKPAGSLESMSVDELVMTLTGLEPVS